MCGFFITNSARIFKKDEQLIEDKLRFRGPDCSSGLVEHNGWKAYHARLSIIDPLSGSNQPMIDEQGGLLVFNGEILNYIELGLKYFNKKFSSDTELLSRLLSYGKLNLIELDGFFAFVYINGAGEIKHASRDSFGVKPLFYHQDSHGVSFCSEPNVLKHLFGCVKDELAIEEYYATRAPIFSGSYFQGVQQVEPGTCFIGGQYFNCATFLDAKYSVTPIVNIKSALEVGLKTRLVSDVPVGLLLSRGIDSNLLRSLGRFDRYYSIGFDGDEDIEYLRSQDILNLKLVSCSNNTYREAFNYLLDLRGEPLSVPNEVLLYIISKEASEDGIKVLLSGEGADEFFGGYDRIFQWAIKKNEFNLDEFLEKYCYLPPKNGSRLYCRFKSLFDSVNFNNVFETVRWFFIRYHMPVLFRRLDFALMAAGVEGREPIANMHSFLQAVKVSPTDLMGNELGKTPLREIIKDYMGTSFAYEKKVGFPVDLKKVFDEYSDLSSYEIWFQENLKVFK